jgi:hypothetical protein
MIALTASSSVPGPDVAIFRRSLSASASVPRHMVWADCFSSASMNENNPSCSCHSRRRSAIERSRITSYVPASSSSNPGADLMNSTAAS